ncbi:ATP-binding protein [Nonomuraea sp. NPDC050328]|uniref:ATP-binding protein n=1 Tax=Nonomuraea sp. NPDC050328 TaxID=3364361 RepID=UPI003796F186
MRSWSLAAQMLALQLVVVVATVTGGAVLALVQAHDLLTDEAAGTARAVAAGVAASPDVVAGLSAPARLQPHAEAVRQATGVDFITIMDPTGRRYTHPNPAQIGKRFLGHIEPALRGETFTETYTGTLGPSMRAVAPVFSGGRVVALVSAGITIDRISARLRDQLAWAALIGLLGLGLGTCGTWLVGARLRRQTHGLGPVELARIHDHHDAILHTVREGLLLAGPDDRLILCNDAARTLLDLPPNPEGHPLPAVGLPTPEDPHRSTLHLPTADLPRLAPDLPTEDLPQPAPDLPTQEPPQPAPDLPQENPPRLAPDLTKEDPPRRAPALLGSPPPPRLPQPDPADVAAPGEQAYPKLPAPPHTEPPPHIGPPPRTEARPATEAPTAAEPPSPGGRTDEIHLVGDRVLAVSRAPSRHGTVVTLRDHTELQALAGQLDAERGFANSLRASAHEAANRLHTVITLVELGRTKQAVAFATAELRAAQDLTDRVVGAVREPVLAALLLGKSAEAAERGIELAILPESALPDAVPYERDLVTVVGNLLDNAIDAAAARVEVLVSATDTDLLLRVGDDGPGLTSPAAFTRGWTTKGDGRGLGLALVGAAVRRLRGSITVDGSTFTVLLPRDERAGVSGRP